PVDQFRREQHLSRADFLLIKHEEEMLDGDAADFARGLGDAGEGSGEIVEVGVIIKGDERYVVGDGEALFFQRLHASHGKGVAQRKDRRMSVLLLKQQLGLFVTVLYAEVVPRDTVVLYPGVDHGVLVALDAKAVGC